ncbi:hypothetical protein [Pseudomonas sp. LF19]|uniref:hypothetical protein n=1 Tax=Pseudomonas sp. LF19 TaxID=2899115 RepID=UPI001F1605B2|nr:hypothetical protein [Pseudomonas sp. LF19]MCE5983772.1 hypothetical protein [Pseudomonas sp. LF19]
MVRRVCLAIGVSTVTPVAKLALDFAYLDGAVFAARAMGEWALRSGFGVNNVRVVDDGSTDGKANPVTRERVQRAVDELFPVGAEVVDQLILSFCGHGLTGANFGSIFWLFSDSLHMKYRIVVDGFYEELLLHGVKRITLITDTCREAPQSLELMRLDGVRGIVVQGTRVDSPRFDRLASCQDGQLGYMVYDPAAAAPGKCVFSGVIADILWGLEPTAIENGMITTTTLGKCVRSRTTERASQYHLKLDPQCQVDPESVVLCDTTTPQPGPADLQPWPSGSNSAVLGAGKTVGVAESTEQILERAKTNRAFRDRLLGKGFGLKPVLPKGPDIHALKITAESVALEVERRLMEVNRPGSANLIVWGDQAKLLSEPALKPLRSDPPFNAFHVDDHCKGMPVLVELADGQFTPVVPYVGLYAVVAPSTDGDVFQVYGAQGSPERYRAALRAINEFAAGRLRVDSLDRLAADLRHEKHVDPMLGVICAYLYRATADYDNIRRMAYFYAARDQAVPYDIALLGAMQVTRDKHGALQLHVPAVKACQSRQDAPVLPDYATQATTATLARIGGRCPWLGLGWDYVKEPRLEWAALVEGLADHAARVRRSGSTLLPADSARQLAKDWGLLPG